MRKVQEYLQQNPERPRLAVVCYPIKEGLVILGQRKASSENLGVNLIGGIGGKNEPGESAEEAMMREFIEEIGEDAEGNKVCWPTEWQHRGRVSFLFPHKPKISMEVEIFIVTAWEGNPTETASTMPAFYPVNEIPLEKMWADNAVWLPKVLAGQTINLSLLLNEKFEVIDELWES